MILLIVLYSFQGLPIGFFSGSVPLLFKKYLSYSEIGLLMMCTMPFSFKVLWSPFVDLYYSKSIGKRKSWIIPTQLIISVILFFISGRLEQMLMAKEVHTVTALFTLMIFIITCQDIAVDSWAVEILHEENTSYGSACQTIGQKVGIIISNTVLMALNSVEFCNHYLYKEKYDAPILTIENFLLIWSVIQVIVTLYIFLF